MIMQICCEKNCKIETQLTSYSLLGGQRLPVSTIIGQLHKFISDVMGVFSSNVRLLSEFKSKLIYKET